MPEPLANPHVALNNARNLSRDPLQVSSRSGKDAGQVLDRPTGEAAIAWLLYANALERNRKLTAKHNNPSEESNPRGHARPRGLQRPVRRAA